MAKFLLTIEVGEKSEEYEYGPDDLVPANLSETIDEALSDIGFCVEEVKVVAA